MTRDELRAALKSLGMTQAEFAAEVSRLTGLNTLPSHISKMCSAAKSGREPTAAVAAVARLLIETGDAVRLHKMITQAGYTKRER